MGAGALTGVAAAVGGTTGAEAAEMVREAVVVAGWTAALVEALAVPALITSKPAKVEKAMRAANARPGRLRHRLRGWVPGAAEGSATACPSCAAR